MSDNALAVAVPAGYRDWRSVASLAIDAVSSSHSKRTYEKALKDFLAWYSAEARPPLSRAIVQQYRSVLESASLASASIKLRLSAVRKLAAEAAENGLLDRSVAQGIVSLKGVHQSGDRVGNWLSREHARDLLAQPELDTMGKTGPCDSVGAFGLRPAPQRARGARVDAHPAARRPLGVRRPGGQGKEGPDRAHPALRQGCDRRLDGGGRFIGGPVVPAGASPKISGKDAPDALSERMIWYIVTKYARQAGLVDQLAPHDTRRTCAKLCRESGGDLEQIQFLLGHASIQTTERYLGSRQNLKEGVNDRLGPDE
jgi:integrase